MCQCVNWLRNICFAITLQVISTLAHWHISILAHYHNYEKNFKDTLDGCLADCSGSRLFLGV